jgi:MazG family protein
MDRLLADDGCPWDRQQTLDTLRPYLLEEAHEVLEAMHDPEAHRKELGDLLFQIVFHSALREREGRFGIDDVIAAITDKMIRRHPHVFGERDAEGKPRVTAAYVEAQWEAIKAAERGGSGPPTPLAGVPTGLPALARAWRLQDKAAAVGFDWPDVGGALAKFEEEWREFEHARATGTHEELRDEFGDLLFVLVRIGQKLGLDAEDALRRANRKFERRFAFVMQCCHDAGVAPLDAGLDRLDAWWTEAKQRERER